MGSNAGQFKSYREALKLAISANLGWGFELFDLVVYLYAGTIMAELFFPSTSYFASLLTFYLTLVLGYFARPIGAIIFGHYGDKIGRKHIWFLSLLGMGIATILIGFLPTYSQIGILASVLIVLLRIVQGIFLAGEWGGGMTFVVENSPEHRRGLFGGIQQGGAPLGLMFAVAASALAHLIAPTPASFSTLGWRVMFWFGAIPLVIALVVRWSVSESIEWATKVKDNPEKIPIVTVFRRHWKLVIISTMVIVGEAFMYYGVVSFMPDFLALYTHLSNFQIEMAVLLTNLFWLITSPIFGYTSDILKSRKLYLAIVYAITAAVTYPIVIMLYSGKFFLVAIGGIIEGLLFGWQYAILPAFLAENISTRVRYSYIAFVVNLGVAISSFAPYIVTALGLAIHSPVMANFLIAIIAAIVAAIFSTISPSDRVAQPLL
ncbi:MAG: MFS transporter [Caldisphaera sp.]|nr:MFS transporter [Caldisphaera sp.]